MCFVLALRIGDFDIDFIFFFTSLVKTNVGQLNYNNLLEFSNLFDVKKWVLNYVVECSRQFEAVYNHII